MEEPPQLPPNEPPAAVPVPPAPGQTSRQYPAGPPRQQGKGKGIIGTIGGAIVLVLTKFKFALLAIVKFLPLILKTGGSMILSIGVYTLVFGWWYALGFVLLIFVHECGHLVAARRMGLKVGAPLFIPFFGASIALREAPKDAWIESVVGIGGPIFGGAASGACVGLYYIFHNPIFLALAYSGFLLNLLNLIPISPLDGGRIAAALSPWLWVVGLIVLIGANVYLWTHFHTVSFVAAFIFISAIPRLVRLFRGHSEADKRYFEVTPGRRWTMGALYFLLTAALFIGMEYSHIPVQR